MHNLDVSGSRQIVRKSRAGPKTAGFAGPGHIAVEVVAADALLQTNPFVLLMDDTLDFEVGQAVGEAHPHAGLETVTLMIEGSLDTGSEGLLEVGDAAWMNAGRGVIHSESVVATGFGRLLQLWIVLPKAARSSEPDLQIIRRSGLPVRRERGAEARLYSGRTGTLQSPTRNRVPVTMVDFMLEPAAAIDQELPGDYSGFLYVVEGLLTIGDSRLEAGEIGWFEHDTGPLAALRLRAGPMGARALLYAGKPQDERIVQRGPFVAGSEAEVAAYYAAYRAGSFPRISGVAKTEFN
jgi:hypothetical protein